MRRAKARPDDADQPQILFATIRVWCRLTGMSRSVTYQELGRGNLRAKKVNGRTLIDFPHGLAWLRSRPDAKIQAPPEQQPNAAA
jgi:hypothetical protein